MAAVTPVYNYNFHVIAYETANSGGFGDGWRSLLYWLGVPGMAVAAMMFLSVQEPREQQKLEQQQRERQQQREQEQRQQRAQAQQEQLERGREQPLWEARRDERDGDGTGGGGGEGAALLQASGVAGALRRLARSADHWQPAPAGDPGGALATLRRRLVSGITPPPVGAPALVPAAAAAAAAAPPPALSAPEGFGGAALAPVRELLANPAFRTTTLAAALNDLGSYALIAWHSTFYERVFGLDSSVYAPILAVILPVGGIVGGVGGGLIADVLSQVGGRFWLTSGGRL
jgi:heme exporter protein D